MKVGGSSSILIMKKRLKIHFSISNDDDIDLVDKFRVSESTTVASRVLIVPEMTSGPSTLKKQLTLSFKTLHHAHKAFISIYILTQSYDH